MQNKPGLLLYWLKNAHSSVGVADLHFGILRYSSKVPSNVTNVRLGFLKPNRGRLFSFSWLPCYAVRYYNIARVRLTLVVTVRVITIELERIVWGNHYYRGSDVVSYLGTPR